MCYGSYVTIFFMQNDIEEYFATGIVRNIQDNKLLQIEIIDIIKDENLVHKAISNNITILKSLIVKPIITQHFSEGVYNNE